MKFPVSTWRAGECYGIWIPKEFIENFKGFKEVTIYIGNDKVTRPLRQTFWSTCPEIRGKVFRKFFQEHGLLDWERDKPHKLFLNKENNIFSLSI